MKIHKLRPQKVLRDQLQVRDVRVDETTDVDEHDGVGQLLRPLGIRVRLFFGGKIKKTLSIL
jgi:hypothetical protein